MQISSREPGDPDLVALTTAQQVELADAEGEGWFAYPLHEQIEYLVGLDGHEPVACGALQTLGDGYGEIKRMYVVPARRRTGLSRLMLAELENLARRKGFQAVRLETGHILTAANALYTSSGYEQIPLFGHYAGNEDRSICYEKRLSPE